MGTWLVSRQEGNRFEWPVLPGIALLCPSILYRMHPYAADAAFVAPARSPTARFWAATSVPRMSVQRSKAPAQLRPSGRSGRLNTVGADRMAWNDGNHCRAVIRIEAGDERRRSGAARPSGRTSSVAELRNPSSLQHRAARRQAALHISTQRLHVGDLHVAAAALGEGDELLARQAGQRAADGLQRHAGVVADLGPRGSSGGNQCRVWSIQQPAKTDGPG